MKLFRKIRQKLAAENKVAKYVRYAIGEIFLVVIGILIALQINNWNESRKERIVEIEYLKNLKQDLQNDAIDLVKFKKIRYAQFNAAHELLKYAKLKQLNDVYRLDSLYVTVALWYEFVPHNNTFEELRSSGNLHLIKNDSIRNLLLDLNKENEELISTRNHIRREYEHYLYDQKNNLISFLNLNDPDSIHTIMDWYYPNRQSVLINSQKLKQQYRFLFSNTTFINGLALTAGNIPWMIKEHYANMQDNINKLVKLIEMDLKSE